MSGIPVSADHSGGGALDNSVKPIVGNEVRVDNPQYTPFMKRRIRFEEILVDLRYGCVYKNEHKGKYGTGAEASL
jgi:hypothetical protein